MHVDVDDRLALLELGEDGAWISRQDGVAGPGWSPDAPWSRLQVFYNDTAPAIPVLFGVNPAANELQLLYCIVANKVSWMCLRSTPFQTRLGDVAAGVGKDGSSFTLFNLSGTLLSRFECNKRNEDSVLTFTLDAAITGVRDLVGVCARPSSNTIDCMITRPTPGAAGKCDVSLWQKDSTGWPVTPVGTFDFVSTAVWRDDGGRLHIYGIDAGGTLKVLHQTGWVTSMAGPTPVWSQSKAEGGTMTLLVSSLRGGVATAFLDPFPSTQSTQLVDPEGGLPTEVYSFYTQDVTADWWREENVRVILKGAHHHLVTRYVSEVTLVNGYGVAVCDYDVTLSASSLVEVRANDRSYIVRPGSSASLKTNELGKVTFSIPARGLSPLVMTVNAVGLEAGAVVQAGRRGPRLPRRQGHRPQPARALQRDGARGGEGRRRGARPERSPHAGRDRPVVRRRLRARRRGGFPAAHVVAGYDTPSGITGFALQAWDSSRPAYRAFVSGAEMEAHRAQMRADPRYGGIFEDFADWASDVWEGIRQGVVKVAEAFVDVTRRVIAVAVWIGDKIVELGSMVIAAIEDAARAVESVFQFVQAKVSRVIDWLKALFDFGDIWDTKTALESSLKALPKVMTTIVTAVGEASHGWFEAQKEKIQLAFAAYKATLGDHTFGGVKDKGSGGVSGTPSGNTVSAADLADNPQANWMMSQIKASGAKLTAFDPVLGAQASELWQAVIAAWTGSPGAAQCTKEWEGLGASLAAALDLNNADSASERPFTVFLDFLERVIVNLLQACDAIAAALFDLAKFAFDNLDAFLFHTFEPGVLDTVYQWIQKAANPNREPEPLTLGSLVALALAFPITVLYKLIMGVDAAPPFPGGRLISKPRSGQTSDAAGAGPNGTQVAWRIIPMLAQWVYGILDAFMDSPLVLLKKAADKIPIVQHVMVGVEVLLCFLTLPWFSVDAEGNVTFALPTPDDDAGKTQVYSWARPESQAHRGRPDPRPGKAPEDPTSTMPKLLRFYQNFGALISTAFGAVGYALFGLECHYNPQTTDLEKAGNGLILLSPTLQILRLTGVPQVMWFKSGIDVVASGVGGALRAFGGIDWSSPDPLPARAGA